MDTHLDLVATIGLHFTQLVHQVQPLSLIHIYGRSGMLQEQIRKEEEAGAERGRTRVERIMGLETAIAAKREQILSLIHILHGHAP